MSYFTSTEGTGGNTPGEQQTEDWVAKVKEVKGDHWEDPAVLAKGYMHQVTHIEQLERSMNELREDLNKRNTQEEILAALKEAQAKPAGGDKPPVENTSAGEQNSTAPTAEEIKSLISETLTAKETERTVQGNLKEADRLLTEKFGTEVTTHVESKASELGMSKESLMKIASESPSAFMSLMGEAKRAESNSTPGNQVNTQHDSFSSNSNERSWEWYQKVRRENSQLYYSPKFQRQMEADYAAGKIQIPN